MPSASSDAAEAEAAAVTEPSAGCMERAARGSSSFMMRDLAIIARPAAVACSELETVKLAAGRCRPARGVACFPRKRHRSRWTHFIFGGSMRNRFSRPRTLAMASAAALLACGMLWTVGCGEDDQHVAETHPS